MTTIKKAIIFNAVSQQGSALVIAVLILLTLSVIGIYAVSTSTLDTKITGYHKQNVSAFYSADAGLDRTLATEDFSLITSIKDITPYSAGSITYDALVDYLRDTPPPRGSKTSATKFRAYHYRIESEGTYSVATTELHLWGYRLGFKPEGLVD